MNCFYCDGMRWIKVNPTDRIPKPPFLVWNGKRLVLINVDDFKVWSYSPTEVTHYMPIDNPE